MNNFDQFIQLWATSRHLSESYWNNYHQLIGPLRFALEGQEDDCTNKISESSQNIPPQHMSNDSNDEVNQKYLEFIEMTRKHQLQRETLKKQRERLGFEVDEYYKDISQVNTLVEDNIAEVPEWNKTSKHEIEEEKLITIYGTKENYYRIRSMEMSVDDVFRLKCQQLRPTFWPVIPLNPKPYLNKC